MALNNPYALSLSSGSYIDVDVAGLAIDDPDLGDFTIEGWIYIRGGCYNFSTGGQTSDVGMAISFHEGCSGVGKFIAVRTRTDYFESRGVGFRKNEWYHFALVWEKDKKEARYYENGELVLVLPRVGGGSSKSGRTFLRINAPDNYTAYYGDAIYDELRIWSVARTQEEIQRFMNILISPTTPNLERLIRFDDNSGNVTCLVTRNTYTINGTYSWVEGEVNLLPYVVINSPKHIYLPRNAYTNIVFDIEVYFNEEHHIQVVLDETDEFLYETSVYESTTIEVPISTHDLIVGNVYTISIKVLQVGNLIEEKIFVELENNPPNININLSGYDLKIDIEDRNGDQFVYSVKLNGNNLVETYDGRANAEAKTSFRKVLDSSYINIGKQNVIEVYAEDVYGAKSESVHRFIGEYYGLLFADENYQLYSTDLGEVLKVMKIPPLRAGEISDIHKVILINKQPFKVRDIRLWLNYYEKVPNTVLKFSKTKEPFMLEDELLYEGVFDPYEEIEFFVRLFTNRGAKGNGKFNVVARAIPILDGEG